MAAALGVTRWLERRCNQIVLWAGARSPYTVYTLAFAVLFVCSFATLAVNGKSFVNTVDGVAQQYNGFLYTGLVIRDAVRGLLAGEGWHLPSYTLSTGYGAPTSLPVDPFMYLSVVFPTRFAELGFGLTVFLRMWLSGVAVLALLRQLPFSRGASLVASLAYPFFAWGLQSCIQTGWLNQSILFPIVALGAWRLLELRRPLVYILATAASCAVCGLYQVYSMQLVVAVAVATVLVVRRAPLRTWLVLLGCFLGSIALGLLLVAPRSLGDLGTLLTLDRVGVSYDKPLLYSPVYYQQMLAGFSGLYWGERDWFFGYGALALASVALLVPWKGDRRATAIKVLLALLTAFVCIPFFGSMFNGFSYVANRWVFAYGTVVAAAIAFVLSNWRAIDRRRLVWAAALLGAYTVLIVALPYARSVAAYQQTLCAWAVLALLAAMARPAADAVRRPRLSVLLCALAAVSLGALALNYYQFLSPYGSNWQARLIDAGTADWKAVYGAPSRLVEEHGVGASQDTTADAPLTRYDKTYWFNSYVVALGLNSSRLQDVYGMDFYNSMYNNDVDAFHRELALAGTEMPNTYASLDARASLEELLGIGYYIAEEPLPGKAAPEDAADGAGADASDEEAELAMPLPYGMDEKTIVSMRAADGAAYGLHAMGSPTSVATVMDDTVSRPAYEALTPLQKQEALLQGVVLDGEAEDGIDPVLTSYELPFTIEAGEGISVEDGCIDVDEPGAQLTLTVDAAADAETYLYLDGFSLDADSPRERYTDEEWDALPRSTQMQVIREEATWSQPETFSVGIESDVSAGMLSCPTPANHLYGGVDEWLWNLGYSEEGVHTVTVTFPLAGRYAFGEMQVLAQPMDTLRSVQSDASRDVEAASFSNDALTVRADGGSDGARLLVTVPFDEGWSATVNGEPVEIERADTAFMAVRLDPGENEVVLTYRRDDGLWLVSAATVAVLVLGSIVVRKGRRTRV